MPNCDFDPTRALPAAAYRDPVWAEKERNRIWHGDWVFVTTEDALPNRGDQLPVVIGDQPVLLLRNQLGELTALSNLCAHRGTLLVDEPSNGERIQCPYHAWTYDDSGRLLACPFAPSERFDKRSHSLPTYRIESWHGLVFVCLNQDVEPLSARFSAVEPHVAGTEFDAVNYVGADETTETWECNWKVAITNAMESYHLFKVHATTLERIAPTRRAYYISGSARATATGGTVEGGDDYLLISLPPGFVGILMAESFDWLAVHPIRTNRCSVRTGRAYISEHHSGTFSQLASWFWHSAGSYALPDFLAEDKAICERIQRGVIGDFEPGQLLPIERVVSDFGHYLNWRINDVEPPAAYSEHTP